MLHQLLRYAELEGLVTEPGFRVKTVRWAIPCDTEGRPTGELVDLRTPSGAGKKGRRFTKAPHLSQPEIKRGGKGTRHFLADALEVIIGLGAEEDPKVQAKGAYFCNLLAEAAATVPELGSIATHLSDPIVREGLRSAAVSVKAKSTDIATIAFRKLDGAVVYPLDQEEWHEWWRGFRSSLRSKPKGARRSHAAPELMRSMVTGGLVKPMRTQPKVRGLVSVGGIASGDAFASFKQDAFRSYGLVQAENAAVSEQDAALYTAALERLIGNGIRLNNVIVTYWFDGPVPLDFDLPSLLLGLDDEEEQRARLRAAKTLLQGWRNGEPQARSIGDTPYHAYTLSGASGRVMVRDVIDGPFIELLTGLDAWFDDLAIVRRDDSARLASPPKFFAVLAATVRDLDDICAPNEAALWRTALRSTVLFPRDAFARALARVRVDVVQDEPARHARYGLIKGTLNRLIRLNTLSPREDYIVGTGLNEAHPSSAYQCGRVMAILAQIQYSSLGNVGAGVIQRYYASASSSPALVLGRLIRNAQFHLNKLEGSRRGWYERKLASILTRIDSEFPANLTLKEQGYFALGYYQQRSHDRTKSNKTATDNLTEQGQ